MNQQDGLSYARIDLPGHDPVDVSGPVTFGRDPRPGSTGASTVEISGDPLVSKSHFSVEVQNGVVVISDLGSSNGTFLHTADGETAVPVEEWVAVPDGAEIEFGDQRATVALLNGASPAVAPVAGADADGTITVARDDNAVPPIAPADPWGAGVADASAPSDDSTECTQCQRLLPSGSKFCDGCGTATLPVPASPPVPDAPNAASVWAQDVAAPDAPSAPAGTYPATSDNPPARVTSVASASPEYAAGPPPSGPVPAGPPPDAPSFVEHDAGASSSGGIGKKIALGVGVLVILGIGAFALTQLLGGDGGSSSSSSGLVDVPESLEDQWSESVSDQVGAGAIGDDSAYVLTFVERDAEITSFARSDGEEQWSESFGGAIPGGHSLNGVIDGVLIATLCNEDCEVLGIDADSGDELWDVGPAESVTLVDGGVLIMDSEQVELIEPSSGDRIERVRFEFSLLDGDYLYTVDGNDVDVYNLDLEPVYGPYEFGDDVTDLVFDGSSLVVATEDELQFLDADEDAVKESELDLEGVSRIHYINDGNILVETFDNEIVSVDPVDGDAEERWTEDGEFVTALDVDGGTVVLIRNDDELAIFDAETGDRRFRVNAPSFDSTSTFGANALVIINTLDGFGPTAESEVVAYDWETGDELWDDELDGIVVVDGGAVLSLEGSGDVTLYR